MGSAVNVKTIECCFSTALCPYRLDEEQHKREDAENNLVLFRKVSKLALADFHT